VNLWRPPNIILLANIAFNVACQRKMLISKSCHSSWSNGVTPRSNNLVQTLLCPFHDFFTLCWLEADRENGFLFVLSPGVAAGVEAGEVLVLLLVLPNHDFGWVPGVGVEAAL